MKRPWGAGATAALLSATAASCALLVLAACSGGSSASSDEAAQQTSEQQASEQQSVAAEGAQVRSACDVLTGADASAILGQTLEARADPEDQGPRHSSCGYYPPGPNSYGIFYLTVYWSGGPEEWDTWQLATSMGRKTWDQVEKVSLDSINKAGPVSGLGDRAYYGGLLPSLVLKGDVLLEYKLALVDDEEKNFPLLAKAALARL